MSVEWTIKEVRYRLARSVPPMFEARVLEKFDEWLAAHDRQVKAAAWDERSRAKARYLGPDHGHYWDCCGWEDCYCASYPNPYWSAATKTPLLHSGVSNPPTLTTHTGPHSRPD